MVMTNQTLDFPQATCHNVGKPVLDEALRVVWETKRRALIMELGAVEDLLGVKRSIVPCRER